MYISDAERAATPPNFDYDTFELPDNTTLTMRLSPHGTKGDLPAEADLHTAIKQQDAVIIEMVTTPDKVTLFEKVAKGSFKDYQKLRDLTGSGAVEFGSWLQRVGAALYNSRTTPLVIDVPPSHRTARQSMKVSITLDGKTMTAKDEEALLKLKPHLAQTHEVYQARDLQILQKVAPQIGKLSVQASHAANQGRPLNILALYGSIHRSLLDALSHKASLVDSHNFTVQDHPDSTQVHLQESMYAYFLRGMEVPDETMIQFYSWANIAAGIQAGQYEKSTASSEELLRIGSLLAKGKSYAETKALGNRLLRQELIIVDPNGAIELKDELARLVAKHGAKVEDHGELFLVDLNT